MSLAERRWSVWSTRAHLLVTDPDRLAEAALIAEDRLERVGAACDRFRPDSELSRLGDASAGVRVSPLFAELLHIALDAARRTDGAVDPTVGAAVLAAGYSADIALVQGTDRPAAAPVAVPGWTHVRIQDDLLTLPTGMRLDLGATAKAFTADRIAADVAASLGVGVLANLGGDIATSGPAPERGWQVTVQDLPTDPATQVSLSAGWALATSSTQRRRWTVDGRPAHHIIDPATGRSAEAVWRTVSVAAPTAVLANTAATLGIVRGRDALAALADTGLPARLVDAAGAVHTLGGWPDDGIQEAA